VFGLTTGGGGCSVSSFKEAPSGLGLLLGALAVVAARRLRRKGVAA
jgi:hypothetical protein